MPTFAQKLSPSFLPENHPFKIYSRRLPGSQVEIYVTEFSTVYYFDSSSSGSVNFKKLTISGLESPKTFGISGLPMYVILKVPISNLRPQSASIEFKNSINESEFIKIGGYKQSEANVVLGCVRCDTVGAVLPKATQKTLYCHQAVSSNLIISNMVINSIPVVYPVPFTGAAINK
jgi:hypothetical protein